MVTRPPSEPRPSCSETWRKRRNRRNRGTLFRSLIDLCDQSSEPTAAPSIRQYGVTHHDDDESRWTIATVRRKFADLQRVRRAVGQFGGVACRLPEPDSAIVRMCTIAAGRPLPDLSMVNQRSVRRGRNSSPRRPSALGAFRERQCDGRHAPPDCRPDAPWLLQSPHARTR